VIVGVLLAAGASTRMGSPKALARSRGQSFLVRGVRALWSTCDVVVVVLGEQGDRVQRETSEEFSSLVERGLLAPDLSGSPGKRSGELEVRFVPNPRWKEGMYSSARAGLASALKAKPKGVMLLPVDHPEITDATVQSLGAMLLEALGSFGGKTSAKFAYAVVPRHRGRRGHPVAISSALAAEIVRDKGAAHLSDAIRGHARLVGYLDVADAGVLVNHNTPKGRAAKPAPPVRKRTAKTVAPKRKVAKKK
jgi:CTP:molybdopterin cytidylyltransferase MocA